MTMATWKAVGREAEDYRRRSETWMWDGVLRVGAEKTHGWGSSYLNLRFRARALCSFPPPSARASVLAIDRAVAVGTGPGA